MSDTEQKPDDFAFDASVKKKKKKKAVSFDKFDSDAANLEDAGDVDDVVQLGSSLKQSTIAEQEEDLAEEQPNEEKPTEEKEPEDVSVFDFSVKKKKKKKVVDTTDFDAVTNGTKDDEDTPMEANDGEKDVAEGEPWVNSDRDYTYKELLGRLFAQYRIMNPDADSGEKRKYTIVPPNVQREGSKKTCFANVADISKRMHRTPEHVIQFMYAELGTSGSIDGAGRLILKGRYQQKQIETVLRRYINEYVTCKTCKSPDTTLTKENRLFFLDCEQCSSRRSVAAIKTGFSAQIGKIVSNVLANMLRKEKIDETCYLSSNTCISSHIFILSAPSVSLNFDLQVVQYEYYHKLQVTSFLSMLARCHHITDDDTN